jgi:hypothetical protein
MSNSNGEVVRWRGRTLAERQHGANLDAIYRRVELAEAEAAGVSRVTQRAIVEALSVNLVRTEAERIDPDGTEQYRYIAAHGILRMAAVIDRM